ncbi:hypothetical protein LJC14_07410, partial [Treponema sp. OttesenSCG-928-L16]|nr:hypothetical protein [Treponema sp. OttesenSCG-928-L16]
MKFKKQEFLFKHILNDHQKACNKRYHPGAYYSPHYSEEGSLNVQKIKEGGIKNHFSSPSKDFVELLETIYDNRFYNSHDQAFKEQFYLSHLNLFDNETNKDKLPLIFYINDENKVAVTQSRYKYNYRLYHNEVLNPFVEKDMVFIRNAVTNNEMIFDDDGIEKEMAIESMEEQHPNFYTLYTSIH